MARGGGGRVGGGWGGGGGEEEKRSDGCQGGSTEGLDGEGRHEGRDVNFFWQVEVSSELTRSLLGATSPGCVRARGRVEKRRYKEAQWTVSVEMPCSMRHDRRWSIANMPYINLTNSESSSRRSSVSIQPPNSSPSTTITQCQGASADTVRAAITWSLVTQKTHLLSPSV